MMKKTIIILAILLSGCGQAGSVDEDSFKPYEVVPEEIPIASIKGYAGIAPIIGGLVTARRWDDGEILGSAITDSRGNFELDIQVAPDLDLITLYLQDGVYNEPVGRRSAAVTDKALKAVLTINDLTYFVYLTPFTDMLFSLHENLVERALGGNDPLRYAKSVMQNYFEVNFLRSSESKDSSLQEGVSDKYQLLINGLSQMVYDLDLGNTFFLGKALSRSLRESGDFSGYSKDGEHIIVDGYAINFNSIREHLIDALRSVLDRQGSNSKSMEDYLIRLGNKASVLLGSTVGYL